MTSSTSICTSSFSSSPSSSSSPSPSSSTSTATCTTSTPPPSAAPGWRRSVAPPRLAHRAARRGVGSQWGLRGGGGPFAHGRAPAARGQPSTAAAIPGATQPELGAHRLGDAAAPAACRLPGAHTPLPLPATPHLLEHLPHPCYRPLLPPFAMASRPPPGCRAPRCTRATRGASRSRAAASVTPGATPSGLQRAPSAARCPTMR